MTAAPSTSASRRRLTFASIGYLVWASLATVVAIVQDRPAEFSGMTSGLPAWKDFMFGFGTALSPTLWWMILQVVFTILVRRTGRGEMVGTMGLIVFGVLEFVGALGEPITYQVMRPATFDPLLAIIQLGMIGAPLAMTIFGVRHWRQRRRERVR